MADKLTILICSEDPTLAREIFLRQALVQGEFHCKAPFFQHNRQLLEELAELETRARRDLTADEEALYRFYDARIPEGIYSGPSFETWRKKAEREQPRLLFFDRATLLAEAGPAADGEKTYHVPWRSPEERQPRFAAVRSMVLPVLLELLLNACPLQMVVLPTQSWGGAGGGSQVTVMLKVFGPAAGGDPELK